MKLIVGGDDSVLTLTDSFIDPDEGDTLTYTAAVMPADGSIATATVSADGATLTIAAVAVGSATVTVTASDGKGGTATHAITVGVTGLPIRPTITSVSVLGNAITVAWDPASIVNAEVIKVALFDLDANGDVLRLAMGYDGNVASYNPAVGDPGTHTFTNVPAGTYKVGVANYANDDHKTIVSSVKTVAGQ